MKPDNFTPMVSIEHAIGKWWLLVLAACLGGLLGWLFGFALPAQYEAFAQISTQLDYTDAAQLEDYEEDRAVNEVGWVCVLEPVFNAVREQINEKGYTLDRHEMVQTFSVERTDDLWNLRVTHTDPSAAAELANIWVDECYQQLTEAYGHALQAESLQVYITALKSCATLTPDESADIPICQFEDADELTREIEEKTRALQRELSLARLLHPDLQFSLVRRALVPQRPTRRGSAALIFSGAGLGFILALAILLVRGGKEK